MATRPVAPPSPRSAALRDSEAHRSGSRPVGWRARLAPADYYGRHGRLVICSECWSWQRTQPHLHRMRVRLRNMPCATPGCEGRLRTMKWLEKYRADLADEMIRRRTARHRRI